MSDEASFHANRPVGICVRLCAWGEVPCRSGDIMLAVEQALSQGEGVLDTSGFATTSTFFKTPLDGAAEFLIQYQTKVKKKQRRNRDL